MDKTVGFNRALSRRSDIAKPRRPPFVESPPPRRFTRCSARSPGGLASAPSARLRRPLLAAGKSGKLTPDQSGNSPHLGLEHGGNPPRGPMAEWLRRGLQIPARRFDSGSGLQPFRKMSFFRHLFEASHLAQSHFEMRRPRGISHGPKRPKEKFLPALMSALGGKQTSR